MNILEFAGWLTVQAFVLFALVFAFSRWFRPRLAPGLLKILWLVFLLKLVIPVGLFHPAPASFPPSVSRPASGAVSTVSAELPKAEPMPRVSPPSGAAPRPMPSFDLGLVVGGVWVTGTLVVWTGLLWLYRRAFRRRAGGPAVVGIFHPRLRLPPSFDREFTALEREMVLAHEQTHIRSRDPLLLAMVHLVVGVFWWLPVAWWAKNEFVDAMESHCDAQALQGRSALEVRTYGELLVRLASRPHRSLGRLEVLGFAGTFGSLKARIRALTQPRRLRGPLAAVLMVLAVTGVSALALTPPREAWGWPLEESAVALRGDLLLWGQGDAIPTVFEVAPGTAVRAVADGVLELPNSDVTGWHVVIDHQDGYKSSYGHLEVDLTMAKGQRVFQGEVIGHVGSGREAYPALLPSAPSLLFGLEKDGVPVDLPAALPRWSTLPGSEFNPGRLVWPVPAGADSPRSPIDLSHPSMGDVWNGGADTQWAQVFVPIGTPVLSIASGVVADVGNRPEDEGLFVTIDHGQTRNSTYAHLGEVRVTKGQPVKAGEVLGSSGNVGKSQFPEPHLSFAVRYGTFYSVRPDFLFRRTGTLRIPW